MVFAMPNKAQASGAGAGELVYEWLSDSTYRFFFKIYQDCAAGSEPDSVPLCMVNTCTNTTTTQFMQKWTSTSNGSRIGAPCPGIKTTCDSVGSIVTGYKEFWYYKIVTLPAQCTQWKMYSFAPGRNTGINNIVNPTTSPLYAEVTFNNTISHTNSSPYYSVKPLAFVAQNQPYSWNNGAIDPDMDSLVTFIIDPLTGSASCSSVFNVTYPTDTPAIGVPYNPFQTNNQISLNTHTGKTVFTSTDLGKNNYAIRTSEYRNGTLIGSVTREVQIQTFVGTAPPTGSVTFGCGVSANLGNIIHTCSNDTLSFCMDVKLNNPIARLFLSDNGNTIAPTAQFNYTNQLSDSVHVTFSWVPTAVNIGMNNFTMVVADSTCQMPGIVQFYTMSIPIYVWGPVTTIDDTTICPNESIVLTTQGGDQYVWTILPGGTPNSLSNPNIGSPVATPSVATTYAVESIGSSMCSNNKDTVTISILPASAITYPSINITVAPDSNIMAGTQVTFTANTTNCNNPSYQWTLDGNNIPGATGSTYTSFFLSDNQIIGCNLSCADTCPSPRDTFSNVITMHVANSAQSLIKSNDMDVQLYPNPNNGIFKVEINDLSATRQDLQIDILNSLGQIVYSKQSTTNTQKHTDDIALYDMPSGFYILRVSGRSGTNIVRFTIANR